MLELQEVEEGAPPAGDGSDRTAAIAVMGWTAAFAMLLLVMAILHFIHPHVGRVDNSKFFPEVRADVRPEPADRFRYLVALAAVAVTATTVAAAARAERLRLFAVGPFRIWARLGEIVIVAIGALALLSRRRETAYFTRPMITVAAVVFLVLEVCVPRLPRPSRRLSSFVALSASAVVAVALLLGQVLTDGSVSSAPRGVPLHLPFSMGEFTAVAHGHTPLVDFVPQYVRLISIVLAPVIGSSVLTFSVWMTLLTGVVLLCAWIVLRACARNTTAAAVLFCPFAAGTFLHIDRIAPELAGVALYYADMPLRYVGPFLTAALCLPYIRSPSSLRLLLPAIVAGLCVLNNTDFGAAAFVATGCCLAVAHGQVRRVGCALAGGLATAIVLFSVTTLARTGHLPHLSWIFTFPRLYAIDGYYALPLPGFGPFVAVLFKPRMVRRGPAAAIKTEMNRG